MLCETKNQEAAGHLMTIVTTTGGDQEAQEERVEAQDADQEVDHQGESAITPTQNRTPIPQNQEAEMSASQESLNVSITQDLDLIHQLLLDLDPGLHQGLPCQINTGRRKMGTKEPAEVPLLNRRHDECKIWSSLVTSAQATCVDIVTYSSLGIVCILSHLTGLEISTRN